MENRPNLHFLKDERLAHEIELKRPLLDVRGSSNVDKGKLSSWMSLFQDAPFFELMLPGTHNSTSYVTDHVGNRCLGGRINCQEKDLNTQLNEGIRVFDLRIDMVLNTQTQEVEYWTGHGIRFIPLELALTTIKTWLDEHPSEIVVIQMKVDWTPLNDVRYGCCGGCCLRNLFCCCGCKSCQRDYLAKERFEWQHLIDIVEDVFIPILGEKIAYSNEKCDGDYLLKRSTTVGDLTQKGKQILVYESTDISIYQKRTEVSNERFEKSDHDQGWRFVLCNSYWYTVDKNPKVNMQKCKDLCEMQQCKEHDWIYWFKRQPGVAGRIEHMSDEEIKERYIQIVEMKAQITWDRLTCGYLCWEIFCNLCSGHRTHAKESNDMITDWLLEDPAIQEYFGMNSPVIAAVGNRDDFV